MKSCALVFVRLVEFSLDVVATDSDFGDLAGLQIVLEVAIGELRDLGVKEAKTVWIAIIATITAIQYQA